MPEKSGNTSDRKARRPSPRPPEPAADAKASVVAAGRRTGRRPGESGSRAAILAAARHEFAQNGYGGTTIRAIARGAGVDPALVHHFFGPKTAVFQAAIADAMAPTDLVPEMTDSQEGTAGLRLARTFSALWEDPETRDPMLAALRSAIGNEESALLVREALDQRILGYLSDLAGDSGSRTRANMISSAVIGLAVSRYLLAMEPLASMSAERFIPVLAATIDQYLTTDLLGDDPGPARPKRTGGAATRSRAS